MLFLSKLFYACDQPDEGNGGRGGTCCFGLLPEDILILILQTWLVSQNDDRSLLKTLSLLDVALCTRSLRQSYLALVSHPALKWSGRDQYVDMIDWKPQNDRWAITDMLGYMHWIRTRGVAVRALLFSADGLEGLLPSQPWSLSSVHRSFPSIDSTVLPSIEHISSAFVNHTKELKHLLSRCPQATSLELYSDSGRYFGVNFRILLPVLTASHLTIRQLILRGCFAAILLDFKDLLSPALEELRIDETDIDDEGIRYLGRCKQLRLLHARMFSATAANTLAMFDACKHLVDLKIKHFDTRIDEVAVVSAIRQQPLKLFTWRPLQLDEAKLNVFPRFIEECPDLVSIRVDAFSFDRSIRHLRFGGYVHFLSAQSGIIDRTLRVCYPVMKLDMELRRHVGDREAQIRSIANCVAPTLQELTLRGTYFANPKYIWPMAVFIPLQCHQLVRLTMVDLCIFDGVLQEIAKCCTQLQHLRIVDRNAFFNSTITDVEVECVLVKCKDLKELHIDNAEKVTNRVLHCIVTTRRRLELFSWKKIGFCQDDVDLFRQQAKELQILPVPSFVGTFPNTTFISALPVLASVAGDGCVVS